MNLGDKVKVKSNVILPILEQQEDKEFLGKAIVHQLGDNQFGISIYGLGVVAQLSEDDVEVIPSGGGEGPDIPEQDGLYVLKVESGVASYESISVWNGGNY